MDVYRITHPSRSAKQSRRPGTGKRRATNVSRKVGIAGVAVLAAAAFGADPVANANSTDFFGAVQAAGVVAPAPAMLANGYNVCWEIWNGGYSGKAAAAALQKNYPTLTTDQAAHFVLAAYQDLCPVPGAYDWWAYSTS